MRDDLEEQIFALPSVKMAYVLHHVVHLRPTCTHGLVTVHTVGLCVGGYEAGLCVTDMRLVRRYDVTLTLTLTLTYYTHTHTQSQPSLQGGGARFCK